MIFTVMTTLMKFLLLLKIICITFSLPLKISEIFRYFSVVSFMQTITNDLYKVFLYFYKSFNLIQETYNVQDLYKIYRILLNIKKLFYFFIAR